MKFTPTVPTALDFTGPPITPLDTTHGYIPLPVLPIDNTLNSVPMTLLFPNYQQQFREGLPAWQRILFGSLRKSYNTTHLYTRLCNQIPIMIVSDASVQKNGQSGFAWVIAQDLIPLWRGMGLAPGPSDDMYSGRAEAFGLLSAIIFLVSYILSFANPIPPTTVGCFCDNLGIITTLTQLQETTTTRPNDMTADDRDIFLEIRATAARCPRLTLQFQYVPGHQDTKSNKPLTVQEIHNVECDRLAKQFVRAHPTKSNSLNNPKMEAARVHVTIDGKVLCRRFIPALRSAAAAPDYMEYLRLRYTWTYADTRSVSWPILQLALQNLPRQDQRRIVLFIHDKLPLRASKFHPHLGSTLCPSCRREPEDYWHFLECDHKDRRKRFEQLRTDLISVTEKHQLHPSVLTTFWLGLLTIRNDTTYPQIEAELPPPLQPVFRQQTRIGWDQLYYGRLSLKWEQAIDALHPHLPSSGCQIMVTMLRTIWDYILSIWRLRNTHHHQDNENLNLPDYQQAVRTMYETSNQLPPGIKEAVFTKPLQEMLDQPPTTLRIWLERSTIYIRQQLKAAKTRAKLHTPDIRSFFQPQSANDLQPL